MKRQGTKKDRGRSSVLKECPLSFLLLLKHFFDTGFTDPAKPADLTYACTAPHQTPDFFKIILFINYRKRILADFFHYSFI